MDSSNFFYILISMMYHLMNNIYLTWESCDIVGYAGGLLQNNNSGSSIYIKKKKCTASCIHITQVYWWSTVYWQIVSAARG